MIGMENKIRQKSCEDCAYFKEYINRRKMSELKTNEIIWYWLCERNEIYGAIEDLKTANECPYFDNESWMK
jgi:hypothetical protein